MNWAAAKQSNYDDYLLALVMVVISIRVLKTTKTLVQYIVQEEEEEGEVH